MAAETEIERLVVRFVGDTVAFEKAVRRVTQSVAKFGRDVGRQITKIGRGFQNLGRSLAFKLTLPLSLVGIGAVKAFADFDNAMTESTSIMDVTIKQTDRMKKQALKLGSEGIIGPKELAQSYFFLASAGLDAEQSMAALPAVASFATAGAFDMALATDLLTDAQTALGMASDDAGENLENLTTISDAFVKANQIANTSVQQISEAMTADAATASRNMGQSLNSTVAILSAYASAGKKGAEAGNLYGRATRLLTSSFRENGKVFKKFGIEVVDEATGKYRNMVDIIADMEVAFKDMSKPVRDAALEQLGFAALAQKSITPLLGLSGAMKGYEKALESAAGATAAVAQKQLESFTNQMKILKNQITVVMIGLGDMLAPAILKLNEFIKRAIGIWKGFSQEAKVMIVAIAAALAVLGPLLIAFGTMAAILGAAVSAIASFIGFLLSPLGIAVAVAVAAIVGLGIVIANMGIDWQNVLAIVKNFFTNALGFIINFRENMGIAFAWINDNWSNVLSDMLDLGLGFVQATIANQLTFVRTLFRIWVAWKGWMSKLFERVFSVEFLTWLVEGIKKAALKVAEFTKFAFKKFTKMFTGGGPDVNSFLKTIKNDFDKGAKDINFLKTVADIITEEAGNFKTPLDFFKSSIEKAPEFNLKIGAPNLDEFVGPIQQAAKKALPDGLDTFVGPIQQDATAAAETATTAVSARDSVAANSGEARKRIRDSIALQTKAPEKKKDSENLQSMKESLEQIKDQVLNPEGAAGLTFEAANLGVA